MLVGGYISYLLTIPLFEIIKYICENCIGTGWHQSRSLDGCGARRCYGPIDGAYRIFRHTESWRSVGSLESCSRRRQSNRARVREHFGEKYF